ncbi:MAG: stalk domain-containing protein, partial [Anaerovoracaceae bacterium]
MTVKKKLLAIAVSAAMLCCMMPSMAFAANIDDYDIFLTSYNTDGVQNNPKGNRFAFEITKSYNLKSITTYHWNNGNGQAPGTISLYEGGGNKIGSWQAVGRASSGRNNVNWDVFTNVTIKPGEYYIDDSSPETWSANSKSSWKPFVELRGNEIAGNNN